MFAMRRLLMTLCMSGTGFLFAQEFGGIPSHIKLKQVNTPEVRVIFPAGLEGAAMRVAAISAYLEKQTAATIGPDQKKISIVLQSETTISNGYVQLAPWRSEFFMTPLQNSLQLGSIPWTDQLAIHEIRHVQQYMNFRKGLAKFAYFIAGQEGQAVANSTAIPDWFFEGDAVFQETMTTRQGRGRLPAFYTDFRALWEGERKYSYMKIRNGSFRHLTPNHYPLGYMLVSYGRAKYGDEVWKKITQDAAAFKPLIYPMQGAIQKHTGVSFKQFVNDAMAYYQQTGKSSATGNREQLTKTSERYITNYAFPQATDQGILAVKTTSRDIPRFVMLKDGREKSLGVRDLSLDEQFSARGNTMIYASYQPDLRWGYRDYANLRVMDLQTGKRRWLTKKSKYFSPDLSHSGKQVAAVYVKPGGGFVLHILNAQTGEVVKTMGDEAQHFITYPRFTEDDQSVIMPVRRQDGRMTLQRWNIASGNKETLLPYSFQAIAFPIVKGDTLYFTAVRDGQDKLLAIDLQTKSIMELAGSYTGVQQATPTVDGKLTYASRTAWGDMLFSSKGEYKPISEPEWLSGDTAGIAFQQALQREIDIASLPVNAFPVSKYRRTHGLFNFHSWRPFYEQPDWSFSLYSNNVLNTFNSTLAYTYNQNEFFHRLQYSGVYAAWFPWIQGGVSYTMNRRFQGAQRTLYWNEWNGNIGVRVPLNFTKGKIISNMYVSSLFNNQQVLFNDAKNGTNVPDLNFNYLDNTLSFVIQTQKAVQQIFPRFAFSLYADHRFSVSSTEARQLLVNGALYLPGAMKTHSVVINGAYQARDTAQQYLFSNDFAYSRGYPALNYPRMWKVGANYHLPLVYPDWGFGNLVYFLRVRANVFYDYTQLKSLRTGNTQALRSAGGEIYFDTKWWNQQPISFGFRYSRLLDADFYNTPTSSLSPNQWEFVLPINLIPR